MPAAAWREVSWRQGTRGLVHRGGAEQKTAPTLRALALLARSRWRIEQDYRELKEELGLDHFEGRSWRGWHHHVCLACLAHLFLQSERSRLAAPAAAGATPKKPGDPPPKAEPPSVRLSLPQARRRLHAAIVRLCCPRCPWRHARFDSS